MASRFYPSGKPDIYSYTAKFMTVGNDTEKKAEINTRYPGLPDPDSPKNFTAIYNQAIENLGYLIQGAREAELKFLEDTGIKITDANSATEVFTNINLILNSKDTFERALQYMDTLATHKGDKERTYRDVSRYFGSYLEKAVAEVMKGPKGTGIRSSQLLKMSQSDIEQIINDIIGEALTLSYERVKDFIDGDGNIRGKSGKNARPKDEQEVQAVNDMIEIVEKLRAKQAFGQFGELFNLNKENLLRWRDQNDSFSFKRANDNKYNNARVDSNYGGNALEIITSMVATELGNMNIQTNTSGGQLHIVGQHTGQKNQMKADTLLFIGKGTINPGDYIQYVDKNASDSVRVQNVSAMKKYLDSLNNNISHIIAISDKNYSIKADFNGVSAQEKMNLEDVGELLSEFGVGDFKELINYLANCGANMVHESIHDDIRTKLQTYVGYFLFDHLEVQGDLTGAKQNVVNLINVSGMYIPLSVYLQGIKEKLMEALEDLKHKNQIAQMVSLTITLPEANEDVDTQWTEKLWKDYREERETNSYIEYRVLRGIAEFINNIVRQSSF